MKPKVIYFDWGGVVANDPGDEFLGQLLKAIGASDVQVEQIFETYMASFMRGELSEADYWRELYTVYGFSIPDTISAEFKKWKGLVANYEVLALADEAKSHGIRVAILSNVIEPTYNVLEQVGYYAQFDSVIASCKVGYAKPDPEIYEIALGRFDAKPAETVFIDDKQKLLDPAAALGMHTILAQNPVQLIRDVRATWR